MIVIITSKKDLTSQIVIDWLNFLNKKFILLTDYASIKLISLKISNNDNIEFLIEIDGVLISSSDIVSYWYRRSRIFFIKDIKSYAVNVDMYNHLVEEQEDLEEFINLILANSKKKLGYIKLHKVNKLSVLLLANKIGLKIPETLLTQSKSTLKKFFAKNQIVTKSISDGPVFNMNMIELSNKTIPFKANDINLLTKTFFPSLIQERIEKNIELRCFYINKNFYTTAIFSQANSKTDVDFRNYDDEKPNRCVPFNLPIEIKDKLIQLMETLHLETGSIDLAINRKGEYIFFEVNPIGQFNFYSTVCNYHLEKIVAQNL